MFYLSRGEIPKKRHSQYRKKDNSLFIEEHVSREGFSSIYSNLYHNQMPTEISSIGEFHETQILSANGRHKNRHYFTSSLELSGNIVDSRRLLFFNDDILIYKSHCNNDMNFMYRNSHFDEIIYVQSGEGLFQSNFGNITLLSGDYLIIPRGVISKMTPSNELKTLLIESKGPIETPNKYRNRFGQLMEHSPFCERDIVVPELKEPSSEKDIALKIRLEGGLQNYMLKNHPFDVIGWDGYYYPWKISINDFEPITGSIHQPPPVHQTFQGKGFVICSFVSRLFDYHPDAIPAPYPHSNVDSDEVIFYSMGNFMSRNGIKEESITLHPAGITHGPHPGKYEESIGKKDTEELAVMIDTFKPLKRACSLESVEDQDYCMSWTT